MIIVLLCVVCVSETQPTYNNTICEDSYVENTENLIEATQEEPLQTIQQSDIEQQLPQKNAKDTEEQHKEEIPDSSANVQENYCTLTVQCKTILSNMDKLKKEKQPYVPDDGIIFTEKTVQINPEETVFDVLLREMRNNKIHMEFVETPVYKSMYIKGINNLYEFDCGELSGWSYRVNGQMPEVGCSQYFVKSGDVVEWIYSCDLGRDIN